MSSKKSYDRPLEHKEYLKMKYLSGTVEQQTEKQRKKSLFKSVTKHKKIRIVDDDIDLKRLNTNGSDDELYYGTKEEKPSIAEVIDERPAYLRRKDIDTNQWKTVGIIDDDFDDTNSRNSVKSKQSGNGVRTETTRKSRKSTRDDENSDLSPPRYSDNNRPDISNTARHSDNSDSDLSPARTKRSDTKIKNSDSDLSPPRIKDSKNVSSIKRSSKNIKKHSSDSDLSPPRDDVRHQMTADMRHKRRSDRDLLTKLKIEKFDAKYSKTRDNDRDLSPPRNRHSDSNYKRDKHLKFEKDSSSKYNDNYDNSEKRTKLEKKSDKPYKAEQTLSGKKSGLSNAKELQKELQSVKEKERKFIASISDDVLGKNAKTVYRDSKTGKARNLEEEARLKLIEDNAKAKIDAEKLEKYKKWSKGLVQDQQQKERAESALHEMSKPLARYEDDTDLDKMLRDKEREDDPMLDMIRKKKAKTDLKEGKADLTPTYNGPTPPPPNRFKIMPGYRWDGVNRSNGFEQKYFERLSNREANIEESYRWSVQDM